MEYVATFILACWGLLLESAPYMLFGFFVAGVIKAYLPDALVARHLGTSGVGSVVKASLLGIPLPLCSCGVIPAAIGLRRQGANKGAAAAFLISTPETGVDSIGVTWALLDPLMTVVRPLAAFITATVTGLLINLLPDGKVAAPETAAGGCGCSSSCGRTDAAPPRGWARLRGGLGYAFGEMLDDIGRWFLLGLLLAGVITVLVPDRLFTEVVASEVWSMLLMLVLGVPLYICATASTPIAAALLLKGVSPGAALVFLLVGPATNVATVTVVARFFGRGAVAIYLATIAAMSLAIGVVVNQVYHRLELPLDAWGAGAAHGELGAVVESVSAVVLLLLLARSVWRGRLSRREGKG